MAIQFRLFFLLAVCFSLSGCLIYAPVIDYETKPKTLNSTFYNVQVDDPPDEDCLSVSANPELDNQSHRVSDLKAIFITSKGKQIDLGQPANMDADSLDFVWSGLKAKGAGDRNFGLRISFLRDGKPASISGTFSVRGKFELLYLPSIGY